MSKIVISQGFKTIGENVKKTIKSGQKWSGWQNLKNTEILHNTQYVSTQITSLPYI